MSPIEQLDLKFYSQDLSKVVTIREYLKTLLRTLWEEGEGFSGKRPLGNSGWQYDLERPLAAAGVLRANMEVFNEETNTYDEIATFDATDPEFEVDIEALGDIDALVFAMIEAL